VGVTQKRQGEAVFHAQSQRGQTRERIDASAAQLDGVAMATLFVAVVEHEFELVAEDVVGCAAPAQLGEIAPVLCRGQRVLTREDARAAVDARRSTLCVAPVVEQLDAPGAERVAESQAASM
jgi:hypothetical protein